jgi:glycosyltransferase involved in cell wall biosynthesis
VAEGFAGENSVIANGVDTDIFHPYVSQGFWDFSTPATRPLWDGHSTFRLAIVSWSKDPAKGFDEYLRFDRALENMRNVEIWFIGRKPPEVRFRNIRTFAPRGHSRLAKLLRQCHAFIQMARSETCSNALLEAINCGLPVIYLNSGSAKEFASDYGIEYCGEPAESIDALQKKYPVLARNALDNPYSIERAANDYLKLIQVVMDRHA